MHNSQSFGNSRGVAAAGCNRVDGYGNILKEVFIEVFGEVLNKIFSKTLSNI